MPWMKPLGTSLAADLVIDSVSHFLHGSRPDGIEHQGPGGLPGGQQHSQALLQLGPQGAKGQHAGLRGGEET